VKPPITFSVKTYLENIINTSKNPLEAQEAQKTLLFISHLMTPQNTLFVYDEEEL